MNRKYKDTLFVSLFRDPIRLRELYNALAKTDFGLDTPISINTLQNVLFMERRNDISFTIGDRIIVLVEHQATVNLNMPLRFLLYIARLYEKLVDNRAMYREKVISIPLPEFYVVYNGNKPQLDFQELKLSDAFMIPGSLKREAGGVNLDLTVKVININLGHSPEILKRCETLGMYAEFVERVKRELKPNMTKEEAKRALRKAIDYCIGKGILRGYLEEHSSEVRNMLLTDKWNWDDYAAVKEEELREELREELEEDLRKELEEDLRKELEASYQARIRQDREQDLEQIRQVLEQNRQLEEEVRRLRESR
jgi:hypothetical protein